MASHCDLNIGVHYISNRFKSRSSGLWRSVVRSQGMNGLRWYRAVLLFAQKLGKNKGTLSVPRRIGVASKFGLN